MSFFTKLWREPARLPGPNYDPHEMDKQRVRWNMEADALAKAEELRRVALEADRARMAGLAERLILEGNKPEWAVRRAWRYTAAMARTEGRRTELLCPEPTLLGEDERVNERPKDDCAGKDGV